MKCAIQWATRPFVLFGLFVGVAGVASCRTEGLYSGDAGDGTGGGAMMSGTGGRAQPGTGGTLGGSGGSGSGGASAGSGGVGGGGVGSGGVGTGGTGTGGGGAGGRGSGGAGTGGVGSGGRGGVGTGGVGTGGSGTGGGAGGRGGAAVGGAGGRANGVGGSAGSRVPAQIISVDFVGGMSAAGGAGGATVVALPAMGLTESAGFRAAQNWNSASGIMGAISGLFLANGAQSAATITWNSPASGTNPGIWRIGYADAPGDVRMMNGYLDPTSSSLPATVTVAGLPAQIAAGFDVYVYASGDVTTAQTRIYGYAIGGAATTATQNGPAPATFPGYTVAPAGGAGNVVVFRNLIGTSFTLTATPGAGATPRAPVNGIQIIAPNGS